MKSQNAVAEKPAPMDAGDQLRAWLDAMPECAAKSFNTTVPFKFTLNLDLMSWGIYAKAAKNRGETIEQVLEHIIMQNDDVFEDSGYALKSEIEQREWDAKAKARKAGA
jgi:hypothetical protein